MKRYYILIVFLSMVGITLEAAELNNNQYSVQSVNISNINIQPNIKQNGQNGILVTFDCTANGYKGYPLYFYSYFLHGYDFSNVRNNKGKRVYGFSVSTAVNDNAIIRRIKHFIPYKDLPDKYHGYLAVKIVVYDGFDNKVFQGNPVRIYYSTL